MGGVSESSDVMVVWEVVKVVALMVVSVAK
jgi:hypothetical protein